MKLWLARVIIICMLAAQLVLPSGFHAVAAGATQCTVGGYLCLDVDQTNVSTGTTVHFTAQLHSVNAQTLPAVATPNYFVAIYDSTNRTVLVTCPYDFTTICRGQAVYSSPQTHSYFALILTPVIPTAVASTSPYQTGPISVTWTTPVTCGRTRGQHCLAIWTDKSQYQVGEIATVCYSVPFAANVLITDIPPSGPSHVVIDGNDDGTGGCFTAQITPPTGTERVRIIFNRTTISSAETSFVVVGSSCAPRCQATLTTNKSQYQVGDAITICFNPYVRSHVRITFTPPGGNTSVAYDQDDDGRGACFQSGIANTPSGPRHLHMDVTQGGTLIGQADAQYSVVLPAPTPVPPPTPAPPPTCQPADPGGVWVQPNDNSTINVTLPLVARAYPSNSCSSTIREVWFTAWWPAVGPKNGPWLRLCQLTSPASGDTYQCVVNLADFRAPSGPISISFDVYDTAGRVRYSPNGEHIIKYQPPSNPSPPSPTPPPPAPAPTPIPPPTATPTARPTPVPTAPVISRAEHRFIMFIPGVCFADNPVLSNPDQLAWDTFSHLIANVDSWAHQKGVQYQYFSYWVRGSYQPLTGNRAKWYYCSDTHHPIESSAWQLDKQLRAIHDQYPNATFDLVGHSLGGVVAAYWAAHEARPWLLHQVHALITLDSPLQGNYYTGAEPLPKAGRIVQLISTIFHGDVGDDLRPWSSAMRDIRDPRNGTTAKLPHKVFILANDRDAVVLRLESWLDHAEVNKSISSCPGGWLGPDTGCHRAVLADSQTVEWATKWLKR